MNKLDFSDFIIADPQLYDSATDPLGVIAYRRHKQRRGVIGESIDKKLYESLTPQQRIRRKQIMRRLAPRLAMARKIASRKKAGNDVLQRRAKSLARILMAKRLLGGRNKADVSTSEKSRIEKILATRQNSINRLATKLLPLVRKKQQDRFLNKKAAKTQQAPAPSSDKKEQPQQK